MNIISKKKQGVIAIICAIAMVVTSFTIYNPREAKAGTDYSTLEFTRVTEPMDSSYAYCITENTLKGFGRLYFYGNIFMQVIGSGDSKMKEAKITIDGKVQEDATIAWERSEAVTGFKISQLSDKAYHEIKLEGEGGNITIILRKGNVNGETEESTELQKPAAPEGLSANINDLKTNYKISFANVPTAEKYEFYLDGVYKRDITNGGIVTIEELGLKAGQTYKFGVCAVNKAGKSEISIVSVTVKTETTGPEETTETLDPSTIKDWTEVGNSNKTMLYYIANKASDKVPTKPEIRGDNLFASFTLAPKYKVELNGKAVKPLDGAEISIAKTSFEEGYNKLVVTNYYGNDSVTIYIKVVSATEKTKYKVTVDGTPTEVEEGSTYTFGDNAQGYYDTTNSVAYASGEKITVNSDITVTSIKLNVAMQKGASVRLATPTGLRFQTVITSKNDIVVSDILNKDFVTTGTLITTIDLFSANGNVLDKESEYTKLDIANSGWYNDEVGKFCGSIINIKTGNYEKKFVGVGYATITYHNGDKYSIYADVNETDNARSIYYVANAVKEAGYKNCDAAQKAIIDKYLAKEEF